MQPSTTSRPICGRNCDSGGSMQDTVLDITTETRHLDGIAKPALIVSLVVGVLGLVGSYVLAISREGGMDYLLETYLVSFAFILSISLGALFFVLLQHCTRAGWSVVVRRVAEVIAGNVWLMGILAIPIVLGMGHLYPWTDTAAAAHDPLLEGKIGFLNPTFFTIRLVAYFLIWGFLATFLHRTSVAQDASGDPALTLRMEKFSAPGMILFALSLNFAAFDLLMSLDPHWFSTIFGVYYFAASVLAFLAVMPRVLYTMQARGVLSNAITVEHYHDIGKLLFAFVVFWAYIAFSQYMLIWYGNLPEETEWFLKRQTGEWTTVSLILIFGHFLVPFILLVSRMIKRRPLLLALTGVFVAAMCWIDIYWLVIPEFSPGVARFGVLDVLCFLGLHGITSAAVLLRLKRHSVVAEKDPRIEESLAFESA
jgi:hypothetical protein